MGISKEKDRMIKENGKIVQCPNCGSMAVFAVQPFDYVKQCFACGAQFSTGVHN